jgi:hypothetical protein
MFWVARWECGGTNGLVDPLAGKAPLRAACTTRFAQGGLHHTYTHARMSGCGAAEIVARRCRKPAGIAVARLLPCGIDYRRL